ncbi:MAG TPA: gas vesicle structural protein GvpA [Ktedonobacterales bacterium]|nr:gas vesicle structural protein GvpA [Ktedonobacterales bacterium]
MAVERRQYGRAPGPSHTSNLADLIDRILDKGLVIDAWVRISLVGIELITIEARVVVASVDTYLKYAEAIAQTALAAEPRQDGRRVQQIPTEDEVAAYLNDHPDGVSLPELERYFGVSRNELKPMLQRMTSGPRVRVDRDRLIPIGGSNGGGRQQIEEHSKQQPEEDRRENREEAGQRR